jgi:hypothetical protein
MISGKWVAGGVQRVAGGMQGMLGEFMTSVDIIVCT